MLNRPIAATVSFLAGALLISAPSDSTAQAAAPSTMRVQRITRGVTLALTLPHRSYARNALVRVRITVHNGSDRLLVVEGGQCQPGARHSSVLVDGAGSTALFPPTLGGPSTNGFRCASAPPPLLKPAEDLAQTYYAVLRGPQVRVRTVINFATSDRASVPEPSVVLTTPAATVRRLARPSPQLVLRRASSVYADVHLPIGAANKPILYSDWYRCWSGGKATIGGQGFEVTPPSDSILPPTFLSHAVDWSALHGTRIRPGCSHPLEWHVIAAQLNQPVSNVITYGGQHQHGRGCCSLAPPAYAQAAGRRERTDVLPTTCRTADVRAVIEMQGATGNIFGGIKFLDRHTSPCLLHGRVEIRMRDASGRTLPISYKSVSWDAFTDHGPNTRRPDPRTKFIQPTFRLSRKHPLWAPFVWQNLCAGRHLLHYPLQAIVRLRDMSLVLVGHPGANPLFAPRCDEPHAPSPFVLGPIELFPK